LAVVAALGARSEVLWVGGEGGMEADLVRRAGIPFEAIPAAGVHGVGVRALPGSLMRLARGIPAARRVIARFQPDVLFFTGGYVGVPVAVAGQRLPQAVFVPDIEPALALRLISRFADVITVTTEESQAYHPASKRVVVTSYPARPDLGAATQQDARRRLGLRADLPALLVFGGSRGARSINEALWACLPELLGAGDMNHLSGALDWNRVPEVRSGLQVDLSERYHPYAYLHEEMGSALAAADLAVSRAGAATLGEYPRLGLPAILVPYPHAWRYQKVNAAYLEQRGVAIILEDKDLKENLAAAVLELLEDRERLEAMRRAARALDRPDAARRIAAEIERLAMGREAIRG